ncbi:transcriptional regulator PtsJ [Bordetella holmesii]|uniref:Bacterial regulatory s, gntR family protein n=1 Tax=Bordetella holmesii 1058 TaxID=1247648 RepID=A0ABP3BIS1_9BORD|nr:transcriptional regulator PtsJ [Bordetella holmesii]AIT25245.1 bacterial regulatory s, gntR family protein [Bordetella holmesii 44057]EWM45809.1 bacterial regulatory s, gntR family protein [Bordetella holmesii 70147]EWM48249.1 bacterial regulatory s, gntR family protein [Bordetella holmesii 41130]AOB36570.1 transcriptional regulator PtsJ [Bordetella holmesii]AUL20534.1 transcriptional regulator PtsJ [Bordetella holmesii]
MSIEGSSAAEIFDSVRAQVEAGAYAPGSVLPPVRELAAALGVNRNTVAVAYKRLVAAGIAHAQGRLGTMIRPPDGPGQQEGAPVGGTLVDVASGNPNPAWLPAPRLSVQPARLYGEQTVNVALQAYLRAWFGPDCPGDFEVDVTHGAVDAMERLLGACLVAGDGVAVEDPCFLSSINLLRLGGFRAVGVPVDQEGMQVAGLEAALAGGARAVIMTPRAHNPTGCNLSRRRATALSRVLARYPQVMVIVDDHFALLAEAPFYSVLGRQRARWALVRSVSQALGPDLRVAGVASDSATAQRLRLRLAPGTNWVSHLLQDMVQAALLDDRARQLIARASKEYARRRRNLMQALLEFGLVGACGADGLNVWLPVADDSAQAAAMARRGWAVRAGEGFGVERAIHGLRLTISTLDAAQCHRLARDLRDCLAGTVAAE